LEALPAGIGCGAAEEEVVSAQNQPMMTEMWCDDSMDLSGIMVVRCLRIVDEILPSQGVSRDRCEIINCYLGKIR
jgi:hypothetical protein